MKNNLPLPPMTEGADIQRYLFRMVEQLNSTLDMIATGAAEQAVTQIRQNAVKAQTDGGLGVVEAMQQAAELKALIIKNAYEVERRFDKLNYTLTDEYVAKSDYGTFVRQYETETSETATGVERQFETYDKVTDGFNTFISETNGYIRQGVIKYDGNTPILGIAIGQNILVTQEKQVMDGKEYDVLDKNSNMSFWTPEKLSFLVNGVEVAYFANNSLHINKITLGNWEITESNGFAIRWIGG